MPEKAMQSEAPLPRGKMLLVFLVAFLVLGSLAVLILHAGASYDRRNERERVMASARQRIELRRELFLRVFRVVIPDIHFLAHQNEIIALAAANTPENRDAISREIVGFMEEKRFYEQLRYIDETGHEVYRVNLYDWKARVEPDYALQDKSASPYFQAAMRLAPEEIFVSMFDLNMEHGMVQVPHDPVIRFCLAVFDQSRHRRGVLVVNYRGERLLELLAEVKGPSSFRPLLLDRNGYFLIGRGPQEEWGFMFPDRKGCRIQTDYPDVWEDMRRSATGQFVRHGYLFTFSQVRPLPPGTVSGTAYRNDQPGNEYQELAHGDYWFVLASLLPESTFYTRAGSLVRHEGEIAAALLLVVALASLAIARALIRLWRNRQAIVHLATHDTLTGLPNRSMLMQDIEEARQGALRSQRPFALLFIDLDGFKPINDTYGHEAGDELLRQIARRFRQAVRSSDTVARLGGDEFVILLENVARPEDAEAVRSKVMDALAPPFQLGRQACEVGASIGISLFSLGQQESADELLHFADQAMYAVKLRKREGSR